MSDEAGKGIAAPEGQTTTTEGGEANTTVDAPTTGTEGEAEETANNPDAAAGTTTETTDTAGTTTETTTAGEVAMDDVSLNTTPSAAASGGAGQDDTSISALSESKSSTTAAATTDTKQEDKKQLSASRGFSLFGIKIGGDKEEEEEGKKQEPTTDSPENPSSPGTNKSDDTIPAANIPAAANVNPTTTTTTEEEEETKTTDADTTTPPSTTTTTAAETTAETTATETEKTPEAATATVETTAATAEAATAADTTTVPAETTTTATAETTTAPAETTTTAATEETTATTTTPTETGAAQETTPAPDDDGKPAAKSTTVEGKQGTEPDKESKAETPETTTTPKVVGGMAKLFGGKMPFGGGKQQKKEKEEEEEEGTKDVVEKDEEKAEGAAAAVAAGTTAAAGTFALFGMTLKGKKKKSPTDDEDFIISKDHDDDDDAFLKAESGGLSKQPPDFDPSSTDKSSLSSKRNLGTSSRGMALLRNRYFQLCILCSLAVAVLIAILIPLINSASGGAIHGLAKEDGTRRLEESLTAQMVKHPAYAGPLSPYGKITLRFDDDFRFLVVFRMEGLEGRCVNCRFAILDGNSCVDANQLASSNQLYNRDVGFFSQASPYAEKARYTSEGGLSFSTVTLWTGLGFEDIRDNVLVVYQSNGQPLSCGILKRRGRPITSQKLYANIINTMTYTTANITGQIRMEFHTDNSFLVRFEGTGLPPNCFACPIRVHEGTSCAEPYGNHYWNPTKLSATTGDPWYPANGAFYSTNINGTTRHSFYLFNGHSFDEHYRHVIIVYDSGGNQIGCGELWNNVYHKPKQQAEPVVLASILGNNNNNPVIVSEVRKAMVSTSATSSLTSTPGVGRGGEEGGRRVDVPYVEKSGYEMAGEKISMEQQQARYQPAEQNPGIEMIQV